MKKTMLLLVIAVITLGGLSATALNEGFTNTAFPPQGWRVINGGNSTTWQHSSSFQHNGYGSARIGYSGGAAHDDWLITPQLSPTTDNASFSFWAANWWTTFERFNVKLSTTSNNQADFTVTLASNVGPDGWTQYTYNLSTYIGQNVYIGIQAISANSSIAALILDDFTGPNLTGYEGFESNNFSSLNWNNSSAVPWTVQSAVTHSGTYAAMSGDIADDSSTSLTLTQAGLIAGTISFYKKLDSEEQYDYLRFYIDEVEQDAWSGFSDWTLHSYPVTAGSHTFRWTYSKDDFYSEGSDCAWIDDIIIPPVITGIETNPILIYDFAQLNNVRNFLGATHSGKYFKLMSDIDATPTHTTTWIPIGNDPNYFYGKFDGNNHTISNLRSLYYGSNHGLFGWIAAGSIVKNVILSSTCSFLGDNSTGSIVGRNAGTVLNCQSAAAVSIGNAEIGGGVVGYNTGTITGSSYTGSITRSGSGVTCNKIGGIAGQNETSGLVENCFTAGNVTGNTWNGGLVGWNNGTISRSHAIGTVNGAGNSQGGLVGQNNGSINNSYSRANVSGASAVGGLVGYNSGTVSYSYSTGVPTASGQKGGLCGQSGATVTNSYWDTQTSGMATSYGGTGKTSAQMKTQATYTGWDFTRETINGTNDYWTMWYTDNDNYPELFWKHATEPRGPWSTYPAETASNLPVGGFDITWIPNSAGQTPLSYTLYLVLGDDYHLYDSSYAGQYEFPGITGTSFNPVTTGGITFQLGQQWYWAVKAEYAGGILSPPSIMRYFITERDPFATESFEVGNIEYNDNIFEWTQVYGYGYSQWQANKTETTYNRGPRTGSWNLTMYYAADYYSHSWLFHPYPLIGGVTYDVELYARQNTDMYGNALIAMYFGTAATIDAMTTEITPQYMVSVVNGDYQRVAASFTPTTSGTYYLGILNRVAGFIYYMSLDDVTVTPRVLPNPVTLVSPADEAVAQSTLPTLSWTPAATGGVPTHYKLYFQASATPIVPTTLLATLPFGTNEYTFTAELDQNTRYYWMVVATNALGDANGSPVYSFKTFSPDLLYETFGTSYGSYPPSNWTNFTGLLSAPSFLTPDSFSWFLNQWTNVVSSPANLSANFGFFGDHQQWLVTPPLELGGAPYRLQFDIALTGRNTSDPITANPEGTTGIDDRFVILIGDGSSWTPANILREWNNTGSPNVLNDVPSTGMQVTIPLEAYTGVKYIAFYGSSTEYNANNDLFVDNVHVYLPYSHDLVALDLTGPQTGPIGAPVTHTFTMANFGSEPETSYTVYLKSQSPAATLATLNVTTPLAAGATTSHAITWTPATSGSESELYAEIVLTTDVVPANNISPTCLFLSHVPGILIEGFEAGIPANWTVINADGGYTWDFTNYNSHSGGYTAYSMADGDPRSDDWLITPPLQLSTQTTDVVSFWMAGVDPTCPEEWEVLVSTTDTQPASFTLIDSGVITSQFYSRKSYDLDSYGSAVVYFAVRLRSYYNVGLALMVDDFQGPLIYVPTAIDTPVATITSSGTNVTLDWNVVAGATEYRVFVSDDPYSWPTNYTTVTAPTHSYSFDANAVSLKFFKVVAVSGRTNLPPALMPAPQGSTRQLEEIRARLNARTK